MLKKHKSNILKYLISYVMRSGSASWKNPGRFLNSFLCVPAPLREDLGFGETARLRLNLGSARRAAPTHFFRFAWIRVIRGPV
jgi:hypothetical protein